MPIFIDIANDAPYTVTEGQAVFYASAKIPSPVIPPVLDLCVCNTDCQPVERVFYSGDGDSYKNDRSQFIYTKTVSSDSISAELYKDGSKIADVSSALGTVWDGFPNQPLYYAYEIEWDKVAALYGAGRYYVKNNFDVVGNEYSIDSRFFQLSAYSDIAAHKTVKVESYQTGNIMKLPVDFTGLLRNGWLQSYRIPGTFGGKTPVLEQDSYQNSEYDILQIQDKISPEFTLTSKYVNSEVANDLFYTNMLANKILITNYDLFAHEKYVRLDVVPIDNADVGYSNTKVRQTWTFKERADNFIKTNF